MAKIGYARVSTLRQDLTEQEEKLRAFGCEKIFASKHSGNARDNKGQLDKLLDYIREGDVVVVTKFDRLGRSLSQCLNLLERFKRKGIGFIALDQNIDTTKHNDPLSQAMIHLLGVFAELERSFIVERTQGSKRERIRAGDLSVIGGRPRTLSKDQFKQFEYDLKHKKEKNLTNEKIAAKYKISMSTFYRYMWQVRRSNGQDNARK